MNDLMKLTNQLLGIRYKISMGEITQIEQVRELDAIITFFKGMINESSKLSESIEILEAHNLWRRDVNNIHPSVAPRELGIALETVIKHYKDGDGRTKA